MERLSCLNNMKGGTVMESAKQILALFRKYNTDTLGFVDYAVIDGHEKAIQLLENLGYIRIQNLIVG